MNSKKVGAGAILSSIIIGLITWAGNQIETNANQVSVLQERTITTRKMIFDMKDDLNERLDRLNNNVEWIKENLYKRQK